MCMYKNLEQNMPLIHVFVYRVRDIDNTVRG
jgi:hypothetical protein